MDFFFLIWAAGSVFATLVNLFFDPLESYIIEKMEYFIFFYFFRIYILFFLIFFFSDLFLFFLFFLPLPCSAFYLSILSKFDF